MSKRNGNLEPTEPTIVQLPDGSWEVSCEFKTEEDARGALEEVLNNPNLHPLKIVLTSLDAEGDGT
jgi:hypothetical protein